MGLLVDGVWRDDSFDKARTEGGRFNRPTTKFRNWVTPDGSAGPSGEGGFAGRSRPLSSLRLARLPVGAPHHHLPQAEGAGGRHLDVGDVLAHGRRTAGPSTQHGRLERRHGQRHAASCPKSICWPIRTTPAASRVPVLWDKKQQDHRQQRIRPRSSGCSIRRSTHCTNERTDYYPPELRAEIDALNDLVYPNVNNGVYRAGFATTQAAYEEAFRERVRDARRAGAAAVAAALSRRRRA